MPHPTPTSGGSTSAKTAQGRPTSPIASGETPARNVQFGVRGPSGRIGVLEPSDRDPLDVLRSLVIEGGLELVERDEGGAWAPSNALKEALREEGPGERELAGAVTEEAINYSQGATTMKPQTPDTEAIFRQNKPAWADDEKSELIDGLDVDRESFVWSTPNLTPGAADMLAIVSRYDYLAPGASAAEVGAPIAEFWLAGSDRISSSDVSLLRAAAWGLLDVALELEAAQATDAGRRVMRLPREEWRGWTTDVIHAVRVTEEDGSERLGLSPAGAWWDGRDRDATCVGEKWTHYDRGLSKGRRRAQLEFLGRFRKVGQNAEMVLLIEDAEVAQ